MPKKLPLNQIVPGDCVEILNSLPEKSIDLIFADPPYNLQLQQELWRPNMTRVDAVDDEWDKFSSFGKYDEFTEKWLVACKRVLKDSGTIWVIGSYHNIYRVGRIMQDLGFWILNDIIWIKTNPMPNFRGTRFTNAHETLIWAQKKRGVRYIFNHHTMKALNDDKQMRSDWEIPICSSTERIKLKGEKVHPTQKPEALLYRVIQSSSNPNEVVLDPFFGTGTTGAVAKKLNRHWIGIERDKKYIQAAKKRINSIPKPITDIAVFKTKARNDGYKIPFGKVVEMGLIKPGRKIYLNDTGDTAVILANGHILSGTIEGSIHAVASTLVGARCNGWTHWQFRDLKSKKLQPLDELRKMAEKLSNQKSSQGGIDEKR
ncbi:MAG: site-specific DNA-methyltransferase [Anaerolineaceae bacterium]|nr:MAG: site-specific DNA-methyltransferase [Anaerolineaceae bacterium]